jgi:hypothetical protein
MKWVLEVRSSAAAVNCILSEMRSWQGGVSILGLHWFFANGFMSQENNQADVGGLSIFLCFPKTRDSEPVAFNQDRAQLCKHLNLDADEATLTFYLKKEFTVAKDVRKLQIQVETFRNLLELLTMPPLSGHTRSLCRTQRVQDTLQDDPGNVCHSAPIRAQITLFPGPPNPTVPRAML